MIVMMKRLVSGLSGGDKVSLHGKGDMARSWSICFVSSAEHDTQEDSLQKRRIAIIACYVEQSDCVVSKA